MVVAECQRIGAGLLEQDTKFSAHHEENGSAMNAVEELNAMLGSGSRNYRTPIVKSCRVRQQRVPRQRGGNLQSRLFVNKFNRLAQKMGETGGSIRDLSGKSHPN